MKGMEMMLANMIGIKPEELQAMISSMGNAASEGVDTLKRLEVNQQTIMTNQMAIMAHLNIVPQIGVPEYEQGKPSGSGSGSD